ncbi:MAG: GPW/gp25 family protein [Ruminiclostridium sp.]|jgi:Phage baseplate assembly protein W|nr:GPW/gp25 family protein [Ruminiclostridium sp.]
MYNKSFLGTGFKFPVCVDPNTGKVRTSSNEDDIKESIRLILGTTPGERPMMPDFGCSINSFVFSGSDFTTLMLMKTEIENALVMWEPRIKDIEAEISPAADDDGKLIISVSYVVRSTNNPFNLVYPFYINEGYGDTER